MPTPSLNDAAITRLLHVQPMWQSVVTAQAASLLEPLTLLHAGPPIANPEIICQPLFNSAVVAALYEGWTTDALEAGQWISSGRIRLLAAQDRQVVVPLAAVVSPSMVLQKVGDRQLSHVAYSPLNGNSLRGSSQR